MMTPLKLVSFVQGESSERGGVAGAPGAGARARRRTVRGGAPGRGRRARLDAAHAGQAQVTREKRLS